MEIRCAFNSESEVEQASLWEYGFRTRVYLCAFSVHCDPKSRKIDIGMLSIRIFVCYPGSKDFVVVTHTFNPNKGMCEFRAITRLCLHEKVVKGIMKYVRKLGIVQVVQGLRAHATVIT